MAWFIVINFLVLWLTCLISSLVHFKKNLDYLSRETAQLFITLMGFLLQGFFWSSLLVLLSNYFLIFFFNLCLFDYIRFQYSQILEVFLFFSSILMHSWFGSSFPSADLLFKLFFIHMTHFYCQIQSLYTSYIYLSYVSGPPVLFYLL